MNEETKQQTTNGPAMTINLSERFGRDYKVASEESYFAENGKHDDLDKVSLHIIPCEHGHIFAWGGNRLAASTKRKGKIANKLKALDCCKVEQDGDDGVNVSFLLADFDTVAEVIQPVRRKKLTGERRKALIEAGRDQRFPKSTGQTKVFRGQDASEGTKVTSGSSKKAGGKTGSEKVE